LEADMQELKDGMLKLTTDTQTNGSSIHEIKDMLSKFQGGSGPNVNIENRGETSYNYDGFN
jgi:hypothetical protein